MMTMARLPFALCVLPNVLLAVQNAGLRRYGLLAVNITAIAVIVAMAIKNEVEHRRHVRWMRDRGFSA